MSSTPPSMSEYQRDQWLSLTAIREALQFTSESERELLRATLSDYLAFRNQLASFHAHHFGEYCRNACYQTELSACCGFESIITFFADQLINSLLGTPNDQEALIRILEQPNTTRKCVFLGDNGCLWRLPPISCAMFYCDPAKTAVWREMPDASTVFDDFRRREKMFTHPDRPVLFDDLERTFRRRGLQTPHMYYHSSPGLVKLKARVGILDESLRIR
jgi:hypothetical protein